MVYNCIPKNLRQKLLFKYFNDETLEAIRTNVGDASGDETRKLLLVLSKRYSHE